MSPKRLKARGKGKDKAQGKPKFKKPRDVKKPEEPPLIMHPYVGKTVHIEEDGTYHVAEVYGVRESKCIPGKFLEYDCFIHIEGQEKQHDRWVPEDVIDFQRTTKVTVLVASDYTPPSSRTRNRVPRDSVFQHLKKDGTSNVYHNNRDRDDWSVYDRVWSTADYNHHQDTKIRYVDFVHLGDECIKLWYYAAFPKGYCKAIWMCRQCLFYCQEEEICRKHEASCLTTEPPGKVIYTDNNLYLFEVNGSSNKTYCENLCTLSQAFLDVKSSCVSMNSFYFYILFENDGTRYNLIGYFSKEKVSLNNLSCIMCLPQYRGRGFGTFLVTMSYELSKMEGKVAGPEFPLSSFGKAIYNRYWIWSIAKFLKNKKMITVDEIIAATGITMRDVCQTLKGLCLSSFTNECCIISLNKRDHEKLEKQSKNPYIVVDPDKLNWRPPQLKQDDTPKSTKKRSLDMRSKTPSVVVDCHKLNQRPPQLNQDETPKSNKKRSLDKKSKTPSVVVDCDNLNQRPPQLNQDETPKSNKKRSLDMKSKTPSVVVDCDKLNQRPPQLNQDETPKSNKKRSLDMKSKTPSVVVDCDKLNQRPPQLNQDETPKSNKKRSLDMKSKTPSVVVDCDKLNQRPPQLNQDETPKSNKKRSLDMKSKTPSVVVDCDKLNQHPPQLNQDETPKPSKKRSLDMKSKTPSVVVDCDKLNQRPPQLNQDETPKPSKKRSLDMKSKTPSVVVDCDKLNQRPPQLNQDETPKPSKKRSLDMKSKTPSVVVDCDKLNQRPPQLNQDETPKPSKKISLEKSF